MSRRFVTQKDIDALAEAGETVLEVDDQITVTDLARERARDRGVRLVPVANAAAPIDTPLREKVRRGVIAELGTAPPGLDAAVDRALQRRES